MILVLLQVCVDGPLCTCPLAQFFHDYVFVLFPSLSFAESALP